MPGGAPWSTGSGNSVHLLRRQRPETPGGVTGAHEHPDIGHRTADPDVVLGSGRQLELLPLAALGIERGQHRHPRTVDELRKAPGVLVVVAALRAREVHAVVEPVETAAERCTERRRVERPRHLERVEVDRRHHVRGQVARGTVSVDHRAAVAQQLRPGPHLLGPEAWAQRFTDHRRRRFFAAPRVAGLLLGSDVVRRGTRCSGHQHGDCEHCPDTPSTADHCDPRRRDSDTRPSGSHNRAHSSVPNRACCRWSNIPMRRTERDCTSASSNRSVRSDPSRRVPPIAGTLAGRDRHGAALGGHRPQAR